MVGALVVLLAVVLAFVVVRSLGRDDLDNPVEPVDYAASLEFYRAEANFALLAPPALPAGWRATSVRFGRERPQTWHLGVLTDRDQYVGLEQSRDSESGMLDEYVRGEAVEGDLVVIGGKPWTSYTGDGDFALVRREAGVTTLVVGTAPRELIVAYVESLR